MDTELATIHPGPRAVQEPPQRGLWQRRTGLEKVLVGVCGVALVACAVLVGVVTTSSSSSSSSPSISLHSAPMEEQLPQPKPLVLAQDSKKEPPKAARPQPIKISRLPVLEGKSRSGQEVEVCNTVECTLTAAELIQAMDTSVKPCDNFYQFACGGWIDTHPVPDDASRWAQFDLLDEELDNALSTILSEPISQEDQRPVAKAKTFYAACMDEARLEEVGLTPLTDFLSQFGGWPMAMNEWDAASFDWHTALTQAKIQVWADFPVSVYVFADAKDTSSPTIIIDQTSLSMPRSVLVQPEHYEERIAAYKTYITTTATLVAESLKQTVDAALIQQDTEDLLAFEEKLAAITTPSEDRRDINHLYNPMTIQELSDHSKTDWLSILSEMFSSAHVTVNEETRVIVQEVEFIGNLTDLMDTTNDRTISNYLMWRHVKALGDATTQAMRDASFKYSMVASGVTAQKPRHNECSKAANEHLGMAIATEYVKQYFSQKAKNETNEMVEDLRSSFKSLLEVNEWMDEETKPKAIEKANFVSKAIGYPDWYTNDTALDVYYQNLADMSNKTYFANILAALGWASQDELDSLAHPMDHTRWVMPPTTVNAYYMPEFNSITFPAGILQPPFYRSNTIMALNYGGIGQVIGHEITHGFDDQGRQYDKDGNALPWWSNVTLENFKSHAQCIVDQYDAIRLPELDENLPNATLNGINTQGENIADNGGLREALMAYKMYVDRYGEEPRLPGLVEYTPMQLFFLNNANIWCSSITNEGLLNQVLTDPHSPSRFRVLVPMMNMKEFSEIWECPSGSTMNPEHKCVVW